MLYAYHPLYIIMSCSIDRVITCIALNMLYAYHPLYIRVSCSRQSYNLYSAKYVIRIIIHST